MNELEKAIELVGRTPITNYDCKSSIEIEKAWQLICEKARNWNKFENLPKGASITHCDKSCPTDSWRAGIKYIRSFDTAKEALESLIPKKQPELLPCPFCNGKPRVFQRMYDVLYECECEICEAHVGTSLCTTPEEVIKVWNTRNSRGNE